MDDQAPFTDVTGAIFDGTDFRGADLSGVSGLTVEQLNHSVIDESTILPAGLQSAANLE